MGLPENYVEGYLEKRCKNRGWLCYKFTSPQNRGVPDRIVIGNGRVIFVETKRKGDSARPSQILVHKKMRLNGADVRTCDSRLLVDKLIDEIAEE